MAEIGHTPGPWQLGDIGPDEYYADFQEIKGPDGNYPLALAFRVFHWGEGQTPQGEANARLIAAAPQMFDLLTRIRNALPDCMAESCEVGTPMMIELGQLLAQVAGADSEA